MKKSDKDHLTWYIRELLHLEKDIAIISDDGVVHLEVKGIDFYLYIKSLTYAGNPYPKNTTRAQLPRREEFEAIKSCDAIFLFLGYDEANEVFACWDPNRTKERLNEKQYVSFFSRLNLQESVRLGKVVEASLQNDFKYVLFKLNDLGSFLLNIDKYFPNLNLYGGNVAISEMAQGILRNVEDDSSVRLLIDELYTQNQKISILSLMSKCMNEFGEFYYRMTLKDWNIIIKAYISQKEKTEVAQIEDENEPIIYNDKVSEDNRYIEKVPDDEVVFSHVIDWSPFEYGFTIDKKYHDAIFNSIGRYIPRGTGVDVFIIFEDDKYEARITNADCQGRKGDTVRLLYKGKYNSLGAKLKTAVPEIYSYIRCFKEQYGGRKQCDLPNEFKKNLIFKQGNQSGYYYMYIKTEK